MICFSSARSSKRTGRRNSLVIHDVELGFGERRRDFVLHYFHARTVARDNSVGLLDRADTADIDADAGVKFQCLATGCRLGISEHHADFFADLVGENAASARFGNERREFAQRRAHQAGLRADSGIADFAFEFGFRHERGD